MVKKCMFDDGCMNCIYGQGVGINLFNPEKKMYKLVSGEDVAKNIESKDDATYCVENSLDPSKVKDSIVFCKLLTWGADSAVKSIGAAGAILQSDQFLDNTDIFMAPSTLVSSFVGATIDSYIHSSRSNLLVTLCFYSVLFIKYLSYTLLIIDSF